MLALPGSGGFQGNKPRAQCRMEVGWCIVARWAKASSGSGEGTPAAQMLVSTLADWSSRLVWLWGDRMKRDTAELI